MASMETPKAPEAGMVSVDLEKAGMHFIAPTFATLSAPTDAWTSSESFPSDSYWEDRFWAIYRQPEVTGRLWQLELEPAVATAVRVADTSSSGALSPKIVEVLETAGGRNPELRDALRNLDQVTAEAREDGFPVPPDATLADARRLLRAMFKLSPQRFEVYPTPDGEVAIDAPGEPGRSVLLLCDADGGALCLVNMNGVHRRARYSDTNQLPDGFVREALAELKRRDDLAA